MNTVTNAVYSTISNGNPEIKDWITYSLTFFGLFVTAYFSYAVLKATNKSADATEASTNLNKTMLEINLKMQEMQISEKERTNKAIRLQYKDIIIVTAKRILSAIDSRDYIKIQTELNKYDKSQLLHKISYEELARCFEENEIEIIRNAWVAFEEYYDQCYKQLPFHGQIDKLESEVIIPIQVLQYLIDTLGKK